MKKREVVKNNARFNEIIEKGKFLKNNDYVLYFATKQNTNINFGIAVGTKIGKAHERNRYKRQIRAIIDNNKKLFPNNYDYIIIMKKACSMLKYSEMEKSLKSLIEKVK